MRLTLCTPYLVAINPPQGGWRGRWATRRVASRRGKAKWFPPLGQGLSTHRDLAWGLAWEPCRGPCYMGPCMWSFHCVLETSFRTRPQIGWNAGGPLARQGHAVPKACPRRAQGGLWSMTRIRKSRADKHAPPLGASHFISPPISLRQLACRVPNGSRRRPCPGLLGSPPTPPLPPASQPDGEEYDTVREGTNQPGGPNVRKESIIIIIIIVMKGFSPCSFRPACVRLPYYPVHPPTRTTPVHLTTIFNFTTLLSFIPLSLL